MEACWAHNPEVRRSKLRSAKIFFSFFFIKKSIQLISYFHCLVLTFSQVFAFAVRQCHSHTFIEVNKEEEKHKSSHLTVLKGSFLVNVHQIKKFNNSVGGGGLHTHWGPVAKQQKIPKRRESRGPLAGDFM